MELFKNNLRKPLVTETLKVLRKLACIYVSFSTFVIYGYATIALQMGLLAVLMDKSASNS